MILFIDNYDSFTFNLVQLLGERTNQRIRVYKNDQISLKDVDKLKISGLVLSPGAGTPQNAGNMNLILKNSIGKFPILGVCLGHQAIAQVYGGHIKISDNLMHGKEDLIRITNNNKIFEKCESRFKVARYHSLQVDEYNFPDKLMINVRGSDNSIQAISDEKNDVYGLEFHPESIMTDSYNANKIFDNFIKLTEVKK